MKPGALELSEIVRAQVRCEPCEAFCFEPDAESIAEFFREHLPHQAGQKQSE